MVPRVIRLDLEYEGTRYHGFSLQPGLLTVQSVLESALVTIIGEPVRVTAAGRTDAGVHARGQVVSFRTSARLPVTAVSRALNTRLPDDIVVGGAAEVEACFDARRSATRRDYRYSVWNGSRPNLWWRRFSVHLPGLLDVDALNEASIALLGRHDFSSFIGQAGAESGSVQPLRSLKRAEWSREADMLHFDCAADAFARHMVRNIVGTLLQKRGRRTISAEDLRDILKARDRRAAGPTAPARGLTLMSVEYPAGSADAEAQES